MKNWLQLHLCLLPLLVLCIGYCALASPTTFRSTGYVNTPAPSTPVVGTPSALPTLHTNLSTGGKTTALKAKQIYIQ